MAGSGNGDLGFDTGFKSLSATLPISFPASGWCQEEVLAER